MTRASSRDDPNKEQQVCYTLEFSFVLGLRISFRISIRNIKMNNYSVSLPAAEQSSTAPRVGTSCYAIVHYDVSKGFRDMVGHTVQWLHHNGLT